ncbi:unnamed protein product [Allacma fusca]|uniref:Uncharacterized protein n=1 Tax=Allacma fusca TaxID=39272 RepID=A0A8J2JP79_9HEXA|nr:unnamed protein product [Allacma fusca]
MITLRDVRFNFILFDVLSILNLIPIQINKRTGKVCIQPSKLRFILWKLSLWGLTLKVILALILFPLTTVCFPDRLHAFDVPFHVLLSLVGTMILYYLYSTFICLPECIEYFVNSAIDSSNSRRNNKPSTKTVQEIVAIWLPFHVLPVPFVHAFKLVLDPHVSYSMFAWLRPNWQTPLVLFAFIVLETFWLAQSLYCASFMGFFGIVAIGDIQHKGEEGIRRLQMKKDQLWIPTRRLQEEIQKCRLDKAFQVPEVVKRYKLKIVNVSRNLHAKDSSGITRKAVSIYVQ